MEVWDVVTNVTSTAAPGNMTLLPNHTTTMFPNHTTTVFPNHTITMFPNHTTTIFPNHTTTVPPGCDTPQFVGFIAAAVAVLFYGTNFAPVKKYETGDGMFFQWILCSAILLSGIVLQIIRNSTFYPIVMVGGALWETGNIMVVPIIKTIGLGLGLCIWGMTNLLSGWATGRFGFFGVKKEVPDDSIMNDVGVAVAVSRSVDINTPILHGLVREGGLPYFQELSASVISLLQNCIFTFAIAVIFSFVKTQIKSPDSDDELETIDDTEALMSSTQSFGNPNDSLYTNVVGQDDVIYTRPSRSTVNRNERRDNNSADNSMLDNLSPNKKRVIGIVLSVASGLLYGQIFTPSLYVQDNYSNSSSDGLDYVFACFCGIYLTSTVYFCLYIIVMKNRPRVYPRVILPGIISGIMWATATASWFVANKVLSEPVAFPIITTLPSVVASILGIFIFKEIRGKQNILILLLGFCLAGTGAVLAGLSKHATKSGH